MITFYDFLAEQDAPLPPLGQPQQGQPQQGQPQQQQGQPQQQPQQQQGQQQGQQQQGNILVYRGIQYDKEQVKKYIFKAYDDLYQTENKLQFFIMDMFENDPKRNEIQQKVAGEHMKIHDIIEDIKAYYESILRPNAPKETRKWRFGDTKK